MASQVIGLLFTRYVLRVEALVFADNETLVEAIGPLLERYFTGTLSPEISRRDCPA